MRTTIDLDDDLLRDATNAVVEDAVAKKQGAPVTKTLVVEEALRALLREHAARRLATAYGAGANARKRGRV